jgi:hypothetical protein
MKLLTVLPLGLLAWTMTAQAADQVIGLLTLPEVFGRGPCDEFTPEEVPLYPSPDSVQVAASIRVDRNWTFPAGGGCEGLIVNVHRKDDAHASALPTEEYEYEAPAAVVLQQHDRWFKLRLADGTAWVHASERDRFMSLEELLENNETTVRTESWDGRLARAPGENLVPVPSDPRRRLIGYLTPVLEEVSIVVEPGQDPEAIRKKYGGRSMGSIRRPDGSTRLLYFDEGTAVEAFERPDRQAGVVALFQNDRAGILRGLQGTYPTPVFVFDQQPGWFQVARRSDDWNDWRTEPRLWVEDTAAWHFTAVTDQGERERLANESWGVEYDSLRVIGFRRVGDQLWIHVELLTHSFCESAQEPVVTARGWIPAHDTSGEPTVWFSSRGC